MGRRGVATGISGILAVDKPPGMTSHDVITHVRRATGERRVGHAGTLDPAATGVLVVLIGPATRLTPHLTAAEKSYLARIVFGSATDTDDADGVVIRSAQVPDVLADLSYARAATERLAGVHQQVPPDFSALKRDGVKAYHAARAGEPLALGPREITIAHAELAAVDPGPPLAWTVDLSVSKGTYVRAIARDLGEAFDTAAHLAALRRTASGNITLADAHTLGDIAAAGAEVAALFLDPVKALGLPVVDVDPAVAARVATGSSVTAPGTLGARVVVATAACVLGVYEWSPTRAEYRPLVVLPGGVQRCA